jgi:hypothetical protein
MTTRHAAIVAIILYTGCGPQLDQLVSRHHYREAICAAHDGSTEDRTHVIRALAADAGTHLHVDMIGAEHLEPLLGDATGDVMRRTRFARVRVQTNLLPVDDLHVAVAFSHGGGGPASTPVGWTSLARATRERLPPKVRRSTYLHGGSALKALGALVTLGASLPFTTFRTRVVEVDAPDSAYRTFAPLAHALHRAMAGHTPCRAVPADGDRAVGTSCTWYLAIEPDHERRLRLDVTATYSAKRLRRHDEHCVVEQTASIPLGRVVDLDATTDRLFGARMRELAELTWWPRP